MSLSQPASYSRAQIALHWAIALLVFFQLIFGESIADYGHALRDGELSARVEWPDRNIQTGQGRRRRVRCDEPPDWWHRLEILEEADRRALRQPPEVRDLGGVRDHGDREGVLDHVDDGEAHPVDGDGALLHEVALEARGNPHTEVGDTGDHRADAVDMTADDMAAQFVTHFQRAFNVHRGPDLQTREVGPSKCFWDDIETGSAPFNVRRCQTHAVDSNARSSLQTFRVWKNERERGNGLF